MKDLGSLANQDLLDCRKNGSLSQTEFKNWYNELKKRLETKKFERGEIDASDKFCIIFCYGHFGDKLKGDVVTTLDEIAPFPLGGPLTMKDEA